MSIGTINIIGAGNVALRLGLAFRRKGIRVAAVCNRTQGNGIILARKLGAEYVSTPASLPAKVDLVLISVSDLAIAEAAKGLKTGALVAHTSGSQDMAVLDGIASRRGVFYPLQTFREGRRLPVGRIPFCIEASDKKDETLLTDLARSLSGKVAVLDSGQRRIVHLAAVFAANFTNFMYSAAEDILREHDIPFDLLRPIIMQTAGNAASDDIFSLQTGPAFREDDRVMEIQRALLAQHKEYLPIYDLISKSIIQQKRKHGKL